MKRIIAFVLMALLLFTSAAYAAEWAEGLDPSKPYPDAPAMDLDEKLGYMIFYPRDGLPAENACQRLYIYLPREDVKAGDGTFYLYAEDESVIWTTAMNNTDSILQRSINEAELTGLLWGGGTCFEIVLPQTLELGKTYFVNMARGCIVADNGVENPQIGSTDSWCFEVEGEYGVSAMEYRRILMNGSYDEQLTDPQPGDEIRFDLVLGGDAEIAAVYGYNGSVDFLTTTFDASCEVIGEVNSENPIWGVIFLDAEGNVLNRIEFWQ